MIPKNDFPLITSNNPFTIFPGLTLHSNVGGGTKTPTEKPNQGRGHVLQQANGLGSRLTTIWQQEVVGQKNGLGKSGDGFPLRAAKIQQDFIG